MARNLDPKCKQCRREGEKLFLKGERCFTPKCPIIKRNYPPGQHGLTGRPRVSSYGLQLREKQKVKRMYRILEAQFLGYFERAAKTKGNTAELFLQSLETRLDNVVYRLGFAQSRDQARQFVNHGHIFVDGEKVSIPSYAMKPGQAVSIKPSSASLKHFEEVQKADGRQKLPSWLQVDQKELQGTMVHIPSEQELSQGLQMQLIVEYYSR